MNAINPLFAQILAPIAPPPVFRVKVTFSDGTYNNCVVAENQEVAIRLAVQDARMASPAGSFYGRLLATEAVPV